MGGKRGWQRSAQSVESVGAISKLDKPMPDISAHPTLRPTLLRVPRPHKVPASSSAGGVGDAIQRDSIAPLGEPARRISIVGKSLRTWQDEAFAFCQMHVIDALSWDEATRLYQEHQEHMVYCCYDDVFLTKEFLADFIKKTDEHVVRMPELSVQKTTIKQIQDESQPHARSDWHGWYACIDRQTPLWARASSMRSKSLQDQLALHNTPEDVEKIDIECVGLWCLLPKFIKSDEKNAHVVTTTKNANQDLYENLLPTTLAPIFVADEMDALPYSVVPYGPAPQKLLIPNGKKLAMSLQHWLHILDVNLLAAAYIFRKMHLPDGLAQNTRGRKHDNRLGEDVNIHPTAFVSGSILEDDVVVEPSASVINCYIGKGSRIADHCVLVGCVIGENCNTLVDTHLRRVVAFSNSTLSNLSLEDVLIGSDAFITTAMAFFAENYHSNATIDGVDSGRPVIGGCVGTGAVLGARALLAAGIAIPAGTTVVGRPDEALSKIDDKNLAIAQMQWGDRQTDY